MANPTRRSQTVGTVVAAALLASCGALCGAWLASAYDGLRVALLDNALAHRLGYLGEITDASVDPAPHGVFRGALVIMFLVGLVGGLITFAATVVSRRSVGDPEAVAYALATGALGSGAGFVWLSTGWPTVQAGPENGFAAFIGYGNLWVPALLAALAALCLFVWWVQPENDQQPTESNGAGISSGPENS